jgi:hypothetical protein
MTSCTSYVLLSWKSRTLEQLQQTSRGQRHKLRSNAPSPWQRGKPTAQELERLGAILIARPDTSLHACETPVSATKSSDTARRSRLHGPVSVVVAMTGCVRNGTHQRCHYLYTPSRSPCSIALIGSDRNFEATATATNRVLGEEMRAHTRRRM